MKQEHRCSLFLFVDRRNPAHSLAHYDSGGLKNDTGVNEPSLFIGQPGLPACMLANTRGMAGCRSGLILTDARGMAGIAGCGIAGCRSGLILTDVEMLLILNWYLDVAILSIKRKVCCVVFQCLFMITLIVDAFCVLKNSKAIT